MSKQHTILVGKKMGKIEWQIRFVFGSIQGLSSLTRSDLLTCAGRTGRAMQSYGKKSINEIDSASIKSFFAELRNQRLSPRRIEAYARAIRMLCKIMNKGTIVPSNLELGCARSAATKSRTCHGQK